jgi:hypothetical protein
MAGVALESMRTAENRPSRVIGQPLPNAPPCDSRGISGKRAPKSQPELVNGAKNRKHGEFPTYAGKV